MKEEKMILRYLLRISMCREIKELKLSKSKIKKIFANDKR